MMNSPRRRSSQRGWLPVKPVRPEHLSEALKKAERPNRMQLAALTRPAAVSGAGPRSHISARTRKGIELIPLDQVIYFIADHKYVTLRHVGGEVLLDEPLKHGRRVR